jgi:diacylglycerol kinase
MKVFAKRLSNSFRAAWRGLLRAFLAERTFRVMVFCAFVVLILVSTLPLSMGERTMMLLITGLMLTLELMNTMVERLVDLLKPRLSSYVRDVKDYMAAGVFVAALFTAMIGAVILVPHLKLLLSQI